MTRFEDLNVHDLVYIKGRLHYSLKSCYVEGWHIVNGIKGMRVGVKPLGNMDWDDIAIFDAEDVPHVVQRHYRILGMPGAIEALEQIAQSEVCVKETLVDGGKASFVFRPENNDFGYEAVRVASAALRAVRGDPA